jgi:hypothetical protein
MSRKVQRIPVTLDTKGIRALSDEEIAAILRGADDLIMSGGRALLTKILKESRDKKVLELGLDKNPVYGHYRLLSSEEVIARIDWVILHGYLRIEYDYRLPLLVFTEKGWEIERETYANELLHGFDEMLKANNSHYDMSYLKDRNRGMIFLLLDKIEATGDLKYIPILEAWAAIDYKKVSQRIGEVLERLKGGRSPMATDA